MNKIKNALLDEDKRRQRPPLVQDINKSFFNQFQNQEDEKYLNDPNIGNFKKNIVQNDKAILRV